MNGYEFVFHLWRTKKCSEWNKEDERKIDECLASMPRRECFELYTRVKGDNEHTLYKKLWLILYGEKIATYKHRMETMTIDERISMYKDHQSRHVEVMRKDLKSRYNDLSKQDKVKVLHAFSQGSKTDKKWAECKRKRL